MHTNREEQFAGKGGNSSELLPLVYDELRTFAARRLAKEGYEQTLQATALVHEAWISLAGRGDRSWCSRAHFFRAAIMAMRHILVDRARAKSRLKRGNKAVMVDIKDIHLADTSINDRVLLVDEMLTRLDRDDPDTVRLITLKFFGGLTNREIAVLDEVAERTVERNWAFAKAKLLHMIRVETGEDR